MIHWGLKSAIVSRYGSQTAAARRAGISESRLSRIIHGHNKPTREELKSLRKLAGEQAIAVFFVDSERQRIVEEVSQSEFLRQAIRRKARRLLGKQERNEGEPSGPQAA